MYIYIHTYRKINEHILLHTPLCKGVKAGKDNIMSSTLNINIMLPKQNRGLLGDQGNSPFPWMM